MLKTTHYDTVIFLNTTHVFNKNQTVIISVKHKNVEND